MINLSVPVALGEWAGFCEVDMGMVGGPGVETRSRRQGVGRRPRGARSRLEGKGAGPDARESPCMTILCSVYQ